MAKVLIIHDDESMCFDLGWMISLDGHEVKFATTLKEGLVFIYGDVHKIIN